MGLIMSMFKNLFGNEEHKLVLVGLDNAGKTTILYQLLLGEAVHTRPTIGSNVEEIVWRNLRFVMWDLGGQQSLRSAWNTYYTNSEFVIMVIDSTDRQRLSISREELHRMLTHEELSRACLLVFANKQVLSALSFYASGSYQRFIGASAHNKMHQVSVSNCIRAVTEALNNEHFRRKYIHFPLTRQERLNIIQGFYQKYDFPGVLGCIDCTHVAIVKPAHYEDRYFNRKHYHSINVQIDVKGSMSAAEISQQLDLTAIKQHPWHIQACCALTGEGLHLGLEWIASRIKKK